MDNQRFAEITDNIVKTIQQNTITLDWGICFVLNILVDNKRITKTESAFFKYRVLLYLQDNTHLTTVPENIGKLFYFWFADNKERLQFLQHMKQCYLNN